MIDKVPDRWARTHELIRPIPVTCEEDGSAPGLYRAGVADLMEAEPGEPGTLEPDRMTGRTHTAGALGSTREEARENLAAEVFETFTALEKTPDDRMGPTLRRDRRTFSKYIRRRKTQEPARR